MKLVKIGMVGFGNVGHGFIRALIEKSSFFKKELGLDFVITAVTDIRYGTIYAPDGLPLKKLADAHDFSEMDPGLKQDWNTIQMIRNAESDVIIELSFTDLKTGEPCDHLKQRPDRTALQPAEGPRPGQRREDRLRRDRHERHPGAASCDRQSAPHRHQ